MFQNTQRKVLSELMMFFVYFDPPAADISHLSNRVDYMNHIPKRFHPSNNYAEMNHISQSYLTPFAELSPVWASAHRSRQAIEEVINSL